MSESRLDIRNVEQAQGNFFIFNGYKTTIIREGDRIVFFSQSGPFLLLEFLQEEGYRVNIEVRMDNMHAYISYRSRDRSGYMTFASTNIDGDRTEIAVSIDGIRPHITDVSTPWIIILGNTFLDVVQDRNLILSGYALDRILDVLPESTYIEDPSMSRDHILAVTNGNPYIRGNETVVVEVSNDPFVLQSVRIIE